MTPADTPDIVEDTEQLSPEETVIMPLSEYLTMRSDLTKALQRVIEQAHELLALRAAAQSPQARDEGGAVEGCPLVCIESPFAGDIEANLTYLRACLADSIGRGEAPFASHALYTQPGVLDDSDPAERARGIGCGFAWARVADLTAVYTDRGISGGVLAGIENAKQAGRRIEYRTLAAAAPSPPTNAINAAEGEARLLGWGL